MLHEFEALMLTSLICTHVPEPHPDPNHLALLAPALRRVLLTQGSSAHQRRTEATPGLHAKGESC